MNNPKKTSPITRRDFLQKSTFMLGGLYAGSLLGQSSSAPYVKTEKIPTLRVLGTHVTLQEKIRLRAEAELGIKIQFTPGGSAEVLQKAAALPDSFDIYEQWSNSIDVLWDSQSIQSIDTERLEYWDEINSLTKTGKLIENAKIGKGDAPHKILFVQEGGTLHSTPSTQISFMPYVHNTDSFGYNTRFIERGIPYQTESWGWLLDPRWKGKVSLVNAPTIGLFDMALAAQANEMMTFNDIGNMSRSELNQLFSILIELKQEGHFSGFWNSVPESVDFFSTGRAILGSMFSPGISTLNGMGIPVVYAAPKEGYRAWQGVMCLSSMTEGYAKDAAYKFMNWWLSGWPGAFIARQGYYISNPERSKQYLSQEEWDYWYDGREASIDLRGTDGNISVKAGSVRNGGSYTNRFSNVAVWNSVMDTYEYTLPLWHELILS